MTLTTRETRTSARKPIALTRTPRDTIAWAVRSAAAPRPRIVRDKPIVGRRIELSRTRHDTVQWVLRGTPWGLITVSVAAALLVLAAIGLWLLVPVIDSTVAQVMASASQAIGSILDAITSFPGWLGSQF